MKNLTPASKKVIAISAAVLVVIVFLGQLDDTETVPANEPLTAAEQARADSLAIENARRQARADSLAIENARRQARADSLAIENARRQAQADSLAKVRRLERAQQKAAEVQGLTVAAFQAELRACEIKWANPLFEVCEEEKQDLQDVQASTEWLLRKAEQAITYARNMRSKAESETNNLQEATAYNKAAEAWERVDSAYAELMVLTASLE